MSATRSVRSVAREMDPKIFQPIDKPIAHELEGDIRGRGKKRDLASELGLFDSQSRVAQDSSTQLANNSILGYWSVSTWIWIILVPVIVWFILLLLRPEFVNTDKDGDRVLDHRQLILWTLVISLIIWIVLFASNYCRDCP